MKKTSATWSRQIAAKNFVKKCRNLAGRTPYQRPLQTDADKEQKDDEVSDQEDTINTLDVIAELHPGKNSQIAAKKISQKYKKIRKQKSKITFSDYLEK